LSKLRPNSTIVSLIAATTFVLAACASPTVTLSPTASTLASLAPTAPSSSATASSSVATGSTTPTASRTGFAFSADAVVAYYESQGYACSAEQPSTKAVGFFLRSCETVDGAGRTRVIGVVTDPNGGLANGFASVQGKETETFLAPVDALEPLAGFLGAMLGEDQGSTLLPWLAGHLGDTYAETTIGPIKIATYTESEDDHSRLYVEVANQAYLDAPGVDGP
jgi:predicted small secreted protein